MSTPETISAAARDAAYEWGKRLLLKQGLDPDILKESLRELHIRVYGVPPDNASENEESPRE